MVVKSLVLRPMAVTLKHLFKPPVTLQYPDEKLTLSERYRGLHALHLEKCISCASCARICPNQCIEMVFAGEKEVKKGDKVIKKKITHPSIYIGRCMFCGLCEEVCPTDTIEMTDFYELADYDRKRLYYSYEDLAIEAKKPKKKEEA
jgi:NADH-quinone oxidoreductase chain I